MNKEPVRVNWDDLKTVKELRRQGINVESLEFHGESPLHWLTTLPGRREKRRKAGLTVLSDEFPDYIPYAVHHKPHPLWGECIVFVRADKRLTVTCFRKELLSENPIQTRCWYETFESERLPESASVKDSLQSGQTRRVHNPRRDAEAGRRSEAVQKREGGTNHLSRKGGHGGVRGQKVD